MIRKLLWCSALILTSFMANSQTTVEFGTEKDNSIYSENENSNGLGKIYAGQNCDDLSRRGLIEFDIRSLIPFGATITDVTLTLNMDGVDPGAGTQAYTLHRVAKEWGEGESFGAADGAVAIAPDATWVDAMFETQEWDDLGGDFNPIVSASSMVSEVLGDFTWTSPAMVTNVQHWLDYPESNHGWVLIGDESVLCSARSFGSKELGTAPVLSVTYECTSGEPVIVCQSLTVFLDETGSATIDPEDLDGGSADLCGGLLSYTASQTSFTCGDIFAGAIPPSLILSGVYDCTLPGGQPKGVEVYVINDIEDLSQYGIGFANNGGGTDGEEFTFPAVAASAGTYLYISSEDIRFEQWFGFDPSYTDGAATINGDDAVELFYEGTVIDVFGDIDVDGTGEPWEYLDGWAYRIPETDLDGTVFNLANWIFSGTNVLDGESENASAVLPVPIKSYTKDPAVGTVVTMYIEDADGNIDSCVTSVMVLDTLPPTMDCIGEVTYVLDETGSIVIDPTDIDLATEDACGVVEFSLSKTNFSCADAGENLVWLYATDIYGNIDSCENTVVIDISEVLTITTDDTINPTCFEGTDGSILISVSGGTPDYLYDWDNDGVGDFDDTEDLMGIGEGTYQIVVVDANGCELTADFAIEEPAEISIVTEVTNETCPGAGDGAIVITASGGSEPYEGDDDMTELIADDYDITIVDINGCTNSFTVVVGVDEVFDLTITNGGTELVSNQIGAAYQWLTCPDYVEIDGATDQTFIPESDGDYAVEITLDGGCVDTSACVAFLYFSLPEENNQIAIYPNPTNGYLTVLLNGNINFNKIVIQDVKGSIVLEKSITNNSETLNLSSLENGVYFIKVNTNMGVITKRIILQK